MTVRILTGDCRDVLGKLDAESVDCVVTSCSIATHARLAQNVQDQIGSARANGGRKTNGNMKAVARKQDGHSRRHDGFNDRYFGKVRDNESMNSALAIMPETRYLRNYEPAPLHVWEMSTQPFSEAHFATFPPELVERCVMAGCPGGGLILDPFGGSGTVGMVADRLQRSAILIDLNSEYVEMGARRISNDSPLFAKVSA
jgi:DNA modification methylase